VQSLAIDRRLDADPPPEWELLHGDLLVALDA
jgi:hypothetical protein